MVKETAESFNLRYNDNPTFSGALASHVRFLKTLGRNEVIISAH